jgi:catechol 2,3-dioxygenase-like lactoylglutathione lyase family enzyme
VAEADGGPGAALDHVQLALPEGGEAAARRFYGELLGLAEVAKPEPLRASGGVWFEPGLHLGIEDDFRPALKAHPALRMADLDAAADRLEAAGADVEWDERWPGVRRLYTHDPFGNRLELLAPPAGRTRRRR